MDEYISRQDVLEIVKRICGDNSAALAEISKLTIYDTAKQFYNEDCFEGYIEGLKDGEKSKVSKTVIENQGEIIRELSALKNLIAQLEQAVRFHTHAPIYMYQPFQLPWFRKPGGYGGHGGGQGCGHGGGQE